MPRVFVFDSSKNEIHYNLSTFQPDLGGIKLSQWSVTRGQLLKGEKIGSSPMASSSKGKTELSLRKDPALKYFKHLFPTPLALPITEDSPSIHLFYLPGICLYGPYFRQYQPLWDIQKKILSRQKN